MVKCQYCRTENRADATYCNHCGAALYPGTTPGGPQGPRPMNATGRMAPQTLLRGRYLIVKNIGQGGMAAVYKATVLKTGALVAVKEMSQEGLSPEELREALDSFDSEARMLQKLQHPNLPRVYESFSENARHYLVMDFIDGQTLEERQRAAGGGALSEEAVLGWARQVCAVLSYLHTRTPPIIFRDLKPANIMVTPAGDIKLIDFGIARVFRHGRTQDTQVLGTPGFAPPEQYGKAQTDPRADIYSLGCTLYQLLTGYDPATTPFNLPPMHSRNPRISMQTQRAIERATQLNRDARYSTVDDFARDLMTSPYAPRQQQAARKTAAPQGAPRATTPHTAVPPNAATAGVSQTASAAHAAPSSMAATVVVQPHAVDFGRLVRGQRGTFSITIGGYGGARVRGQVKSLSPWLGMDRERFDGSSTLIQLVADTRKAQKDGPERTTLQIMCDGHYLYVPVSVEVVAAGTSPAAAANGTQASQAGKAAQPFRSIPKKYQAPAPRRKRWLWFAMASVLGFGLAAGGLTQGQRLLAALAPQQPLTAPLALALLFAATLLGVVGALAGSPSGGKGTFWSRARTALVGGLIGLLILLAAGNAWLWPDLAGILSKQVHMPSHVLLLAPALIGVGAALGADPAGSRVFIAVGAFIARYARIFIALAIIVAGGWGGYVLTSTVPCLVPIGVVAGIALGIVLIRAFGLTPRKPNWRRMARARWP
ncbi:MAG: protein kinase domain-containing protein [Ktedonobacterales bacterium]